MEECFTLKVPKMECDESFSTDTDFPNDSLLEQVFKMEVEENDVMEKEEASSSGNSEFSRMDECFTLKVPKMEYDESFSTDTDFPNDSLLEQVFKMEVVENDVMEKKEMSSSGNSEEIDDEIDDSPRKIVARGQVLETFIKKFAENPHPSVLEMKELAETVQVRYRTVFEYFDQRRKKKKIVCEPNDPCERVKMYLSQENEPGRYMRMPEEKRKLIQDEIENVIFSGESLTLGALHNIMEKTDAPPNYIRSIHDAVRRRFSRDPHFFNRKKAKKNLGLKESSFTLSIETLRLLEESYLRKKYECEEKEWKPREIDELAAQLNIDSEIVKNWLDTRRGAVQNLDKLLDNETEEFGAAKTFFSKKLTAALVAELGKIGKPTKQEYEEIGKRVGLKAQQVKNYYNKLLRNKRKYDSWERARKKIDALPTEKKEQVERIAAMKKISWKSMISKEASRIGVSKETLHSYICWRKSEKHRPY